MNHFLSKFDEFEMLHSLECFISSPSKHVRFIHEATYHQNKRNENEKKKKFGHSIPFVGPQGF